MKKGMISPEPGIEEASVSHDDSITVVTINGRIGISSNRKIARVGGGQAAGGGKVDFIASFNSN